MYGHPGVDKKNESIVEHSIFYLVQDDYIIIYIDTKIDPGCLGGLPNPEKVMVMAAWCHFFHVRTVRLTFQIDMGSQ